MGEARGDRLGLGMTLAAGVALAGAARGEEFRDLQDCIDAEAARYERVLAQHERRAPEAEDFDLWSAWYVEDCGNEALAICDRAEDAVACQFALAARQAALARKVRAGLPDPDAVRGDDWSVTLYARWHALAEGRSAGADCAGAETDPRWKSWCAARQTNGDLQSAVVAWQVARYLGVAEPGVAAGWAHPVPPLRPVARGIDQ